LAAATKKGIAVKKIALAATLAITLCSQAQARFLEIVAEPGAAPQVAAGAPRGIVSVAVDPSELAEPAVFAMMLLGLCLIGYRVSRDSSETFK
jgi:hypothetical protein